MLHSWLTLGFRAFLDISMEKFGQNWHGMLNLWHLDMELFLTFSWKKLDKNDNGCFIPDIWVSSFFGRFHGKNRHGMLISWHLGIELFLNIFMEKSIQKWHRMLYSWYLGIELSWIYIIFRSTSSHICKSTSSRICRSLLSLTGCLPFSLLFFCYSHL